MQAAAVYLRRFREARGMSQEDVADALGVASKSVYNWEAGGETKGKTLAAWIKCVHAVSEDVIGLINDEAATEADGQQLAEIRLSAEQRGQVQRLTRDVGPHAIVRAATAVLQSPEIQEEILRRAVEFEDGPEERPSRMPHSLKRRRKKR